MKPKTKVRSLPWEQRDYARGKRRGLDEILSSLTPEGLDLFEKEFPAIVRRARLKCIAGGKKDVAEESHEIQD
jgi:hypothetical protein